MHGYGDDPTVTIPPSFLFTKTDDPAKCKILLFLPTYGASLIDLHI